MNAARLSQGQRPDEKKNVQGRWGGFHDIKTQDEKVLSRRYRGALTGAVRRRQRR